MMVATDAIFLDLVRFGDYLGMVQNNYSPKMDGFQIHQDQPMHGCIWTPILSHTQFRGWHLTLKIDVWDAQV